MHAMTYTEAEQVLEQHSEIVAELGMSYVCGGGRAEDAGYATSLALTGEHHNIVAEARAVIAHEQEVARQRWIESEIGEPTVVYTDNDMPF